MRTVPQPASSLVCQVMEQPDAPLKLSDYTCLYVRGRSGENGINHMPSYTNTDTKPIAAVAIGFVSFDVFNEHIGSFEGISMDPIAPAELVGGSQWVQKRLTGFAFQTGVAYASRVRFADGTIWKADKKKVAAWMAKIESDFDAATLDRKREPTDDK